MKAIDTNSYVLDASVALKWAFVDEVTPQSVAALKRLDRGHAEVPGIWPFEVWNIVMHAEIHGRLTTEQRHEFLLKLSRLDIRVEVRSISEIGTVVPLARKHVLTVYDAAYLDLAMRKQLPIATADSQFRRAAEQENLPLIEE